jgi:hypothetical protein
MSEWLDARGCVTDAGLVALAGARPGEAPPELAQHIASCARCQDRWLQSAVPATERRVAPDSTSRRRWGMLAIVFGMLMFALLSLVVTLSYLAG